LVGGLELKLALIEIPIRRLFSSSYG